MLSLTPILCYLLQWLIYWLIFSLVQLVEAVLWPVLKWCAYTLLLTVICPSTRVTPLKHALDIAPEHKRNSR